MIKVVGLGLWRSSDKGRNWKRIDDDTISGRDETGWATSLDQNAPARIASFSLDGSAGWTTDGIKWKSFASLGRNWDFGSVDWAAPVLAETPEPDSGPVMVSIEYRVQPDKRSEFVAAMHGVREMRRRNGAYFWELFHDSAEPTRYIEVFMDESWLEHLRQHERVSVADRAIQKNAKQYLVEGTDTKSFHWLADRES
jgi:quinol monooxygenase YgiN